MTDLHSDFGRPKKDPFSKNRTPHLNNARYFFNKNEMLHLKLGERAYIFKRPGNLNSTNLCLDREVPGPLESTVHLHCTRHRVKCLRYTGFDKTDEIPWSCGSSILLGWQCTQRNILPGLVPRAKWQRGSFQAGLRCWGPFAFAADEKSEVKPHWNHALYKATKNDNHWNWNFTRCLVNITCSSPKSDGIYRRKINSSSVLPIWQHPLKAFFCLFIAFLESGSQSYQKVYTLSKFMIIKFCGVILRHYLAGLLLVMPLGSIKFFTMKQHNTHTDNMLHFLRITNWWKI